jgi:hypothetical protein
MGGEMNCSYPMGGRKMSSTKLAAIAVFLTATSPCLAIYFSDPSGDQFATAIPPELDQIGVTIESDSSSFTVSLHFDSANNPNDLYGLGGYVDLDIDQNANTGRLSHFNDYGIVPVPAIGVDYYLEFYSFNYMAELVYVEGSAEMPVGSYPIDFNGLVASVTLPRSQTSPTAGILIGNIYNFTTLVANANSLTDCSPNGGLVYTVPEPGSFLAFLGIAGIINFLVLPPRKKVRIYHPEA